MFRTNPGTWKLGVCWERTYYAEMAPSRTKPPKIAENRLVQSLEPPEHLGCVPGSEYCLKSALAFCSQIDLEGLTGHGAWPNVLSQTSLTLPTQCWWGGQTGIWNFLGHGHQTVAHIHYSVSQPRDLRG